MSLESKTTHKLCYSKKKFLQKEIPKLNKNEHQEIFNIIKQNSDAKYSENSRGVYINIKFLDIDTLEKIINFINYTKEQKNKLGKQDFEQTDNNKDSLSNDNDNSNRITHTKDSIQKELLRLKEKKNENFVFQHFLDKLSISNIKQFTKDSSEENRITFPQLKHSKIQLEGVKARLMKKCRDVNKSGNDLPFIPTDDIESEELISGKNDKYKEVLNDDDCINEDEGINDDEGINYDDGIKDDDIIKEESKLNIETLINMTSANHIQEELDIISTNSDFNNF